jgi:integrase
VFKKAREKAKVEILPPYDLRHAFASLQIRAGMSIPELAEQMGHSPQMTVMTLHPCDPRAEGRATDLGGGADREGPESISWTPSGPSGW